MADNCIFCKIIKREIPSSEIYRDEYCMAFFDIFPVAKGHALVIPIDHVKTLSDMKSEQLMGLMGNMPKIAKAVCETAGTEQYNIVQNNGELAGQVVPHVHFHIIPRYAEKEGFSYTWKSQKADPEAINAMAKECKARTN
eukprot:TRINITY_DN1968_c1_g1_i2.p1 TRINITY_DN1968_c1_g1~~TRINITY_DN1968_c1_g1_i2.p1  ORF type:complete len:160 (+),score=32.75 TRINITY_DN1968_c1_g1_i2:63-482(+)